MRYEEEAQQEDQSGIETRQAAGKIQAKTGAESTRDLQGPGGRCSHDHFPEGAAQEDHRWGYQEVTLADRDHDTPSRAPRGSAGSTEHLVQFG